MSEKFLHFLWFNRLFDDKKLLTADGQVVEVIKTGIPNNDAGPDFFNAKIKLDNQLWAGNIEIHTKSSEWFRHNHHKDKSYNTVILHIVSECDKETVNEASVKVPCLELKIKPEYAERYQKLQNSDQSIACATFLSEIRWVYIRQAIDRMATDRIENKTQRLAEFLRQKDYSWEESFYILLARNMGFGLNSEAFERLAKSLPVKFLYKQSYSSIQVEALLYGQAGFLEQTKCNDAYTANLKREYEYLRRKYNLKSISPVLWKFMRMRPANFPTVRIAQLSAIISKNPNLFSKILEAEKMQEIVSLFDINVSEYWQENYNFCKKSKRKFKQLSRKTIELIISNTVVPALFLYAEQSGKENYKDFAINLLEQIKPEDNKIVRQWGRVGIEPQNAFESQGLVQLFNEYCKKGKCLDCQIGAKIITKV